jgi:hypothetical protein
MDFLTCEWEDRVAKVNINVLYFPDTAATLADLEPLVKDIRSRATDMIITADFSGVGFVGMRRCASILYLVQEVIEYTKDDDLLRRVYFKGTGVIFQGVYASIESTIPQYFRDIIEFV